LSVSLTWADEADQGTEVNGVLKVNIPKLQKQEVPQTKKIIEIK